MALVPFSPRPTCSACDGDGVTYVDCTANKRVEGCVEPTSHLHMNCTRCGNAWLMAPNKP